jgi:hypothetical protein
MAAREELTDAATEHVPITEPAPQLNRPIQLFIGNFQAAGEDTRTKKKGPAEPGLSDPKIQ